MNINFNKVARRWLHESTRGEPSKSPNKIAIQTVLEILSSLRPSSKRDANRMEIMREQLIKIRRTNKRLEEQVSRLEEQVQVLEEKNKRVAETKKASKKGK